jgi:hypothetical protein
MHGHMHVKYDHELQILVHTLARTSINRLKFTVIIISANNSNLWYQSLHEMYKPAGRLIIKLENFPCCLYIKTDES